MAGRKVFLLVDGSAPAKRAFDWYLNEVSRDGDDVYVVHKAEYDYSIGLPGPAVDVDAITKAAKKENDRIEIMLNEFMDELRRRRLKCQTKLLVTSEKAGEAIIEEAEKEKANMIVMGSRGQGTIRRTLLGSVSEYVVHHAPSHCSVTVLRDS